MPPKSKKKKARGPDMRGYINAPLTSISSSAASSVVLPQKVNDEGLSSIKLNSQTHKLLSETLLLASEKVSPSSPSSDSTSTSSTTTSTAKDTTSAHFSYQLSNLLPPLQSLGFTIPQITTAISSGTSEDMKMTVDSVVDWLVRNLDEIDLPKRFVDKGGSTASTENNVAKHEAGLDVVKIVPRTEEEIAAAFNARVLKAEVIEPHMIYSGSSKSNEQDDEKEKEKTETANKEWLKRYAEEEQSDGDDGNFSDEEDLNPSAGRKKKAPVKEKLDPLKLTPSQWHALSSVDKLDNLEKNVDKKKEDLVAGEYFFNKKEAKALRLEIGKLGAEVVKLRKVVEKEAKANAGPSSTESKTKSNAVANNDDDDDDDDNSEGLMGMMMLNDTDTDINTEFPPPPSSTTSVIAAVKATTTPPPPPPTPPVIVNAPTYLTTMKAPTIPKGWTGKTPKHHLNDIAKKKKSQTSKPNWTQLQGGGGGDRGCRLEFFGVTYKVGLTEVGCDGFLRDVRDEEDEDDETVVSRTGVAKRTYGDWMEYSSMVCLYALDPRLPLYLMFPPVYRRVWMGWVEDDKNRRRDDEARKRAEKKGKVDGVLSGIEEERKRIGNKVKAKRMMEEEEARREEEMEREEEEKKMQMERFLKEKEEAKKVALEAEAGVAEDWETNNLSDDDDETPSNHNHSTEEAKTTPITEEELEEVTSEESLRLAQLFRNHQSTKKYGLLYKQRNLLPISAHRSTLLCTINSNPVTILHGETGCGKTTQAPQFILEDGFHSGKGDKTNIICTQPRRVAAMTVAERVADEMCVKIGDLVGYQIRMETRKSAATKLMFCTTGVILRRLQDDPLLTGVSHVIIDEVHERQWQIDFLLIALRRLLQSGRRKDLKIVLMSATLDSKLFCDFFASCSTPVGKTCPFLSVPGRTFPVKDYFLEDLLDSVDHLIEMGSWCAKKNLYNEKKGNSVKLDVTGRGGSSRSMQVSTEINTELYDNAANPHEYLRYKKTTQISMQRVDEKSINYDLIEEVLDHFCFTPPSQQHFICDDMTLVENGAILIFLPGLGEIKNLLGRLKASRKFGSDMSGFDIIPLHSSISPSEQRKAFTVRFGVRKIILATNIAETSVTIPDVVCVIDTGMQREVRVNARSNTSQLVCDWCSQASSKQRMGRAGRVRAGLCLKLYSRNTQIHVMQPQAQPELQRIPLEEVCLNMLASKLGNSCMSFLTEAPQPPEAKAVEGALNVLVEVGCILRVGGKEVLTGLGKHLSRLGLDVRLGKMLVFGCLFKCLGKCLTVAGVLGGGKSVFVSDMEHTSGAKNAQKNFLVPGSDFLTMCKVWDEYEKVRDARETRESDLKRWCEKNFVSWTVMRDVNEMRSNFKKLLKEGGWITGTDKNMNANDGVDNVVTSAICAGLYSNVAKVSPNTGGLIANKDRVYMHPGSVNFATFGNANKMKTAGYGSVTQGSSDWIVFHEKFTTNKLYITTTCVCKAMSLLLFSSEEMIVKHLEGVVTIGGWIEVPCAPKTGVLFQKLRVQLDRILTGRFEGGGTKEDEAAIDALVQLLKNE